MSINPLEQLEPVTIAAIAAIFLCTYLLLRRLLFVPLLGVLERRARRLEAAEVAAGDRRALVERAEAEAAAVVAGASEAAARLRRELDDELARERAARLDEATARAQAISEAAHQEASRLRAAEDAGLNQQLLACARQALLRIVPDVDEDALRVVVARALAAPGGTAR
jgi:F-type H+-transporting ATPase subunit b